MDFLNCHMVDYLTEGHWRRYIPEDVRGELEGMRDLIEAKEVFWNQFNKEFDSSKFPRLTNHIEAMKRFRLDVLPEACMTTEQLNSAFDSCLKETRLKMPELMSIKKCHEVEVASAVVASLCTVVATGTDGKSLDEVAVIDAGDGKGYLSSRIALEHGIKVLGIDCNEGNTVSAERRRDQLRKKVPVALKRSNVTQESMLKDAPEDPLYKTTTKLIDFKTNLIDLVQEQFPQSPATHFTLAGLHTCGNLGPNSLRLFHQNPHIRALCNVGCCYHLLRERFCDDEFYNRDKIKDNPGIGFPMSSFMTGKGFSLGRNARNLAAESIERSAWNRENPSDKLGYRAMLQIVLKELGVARVDRQVGKLKCDGFVDYVRKALKRLGVADGGELVTEQYLEGLEKKYEVELEQLKVFYLYRMTYAPIVEGLILLDRLMFLKECGYENSYLVKLFDPVVSPRCYSIVAFK
uniref:Putative rrna adenine n-6-methyltransferase n=1 Tax=Culex tarsalis TaxID=7177 RepID=A0A1Q3FJP5_CULTA